MSVARACGFSLGHACTVPEWNARKTEPKNAGVRRKEYSPSRAQEKLTPPGRGRAAVEDVHHETCTACEWFGVFSSQALFFRSSDLPLSRARFLFCACGAGRWGKGQKTGISVFFCFRQAQFLSHGVRNRAKSDLHAFRPPRQPLCAFPALELFQRASGADGRILH